MPYGYEIGIECEEKAFETIYNTINETNQVPSSIAKDNEEHYLLIWKNTVSLDPEIMRNLKEFDALSASGILGYGYVLVRIGKELTDISVVKNTDKLAVPLVRTIYAEGFEQEKFMEKQEDYEF